MKHSFIAFIMLLAGHLAFGQITVTSATFPAVGDTLKTATDLTPEGVVITDPGGPFTWNYGMLNADTKLSTVFLDASEGMAFASYPNAELVVMPDAGGETYFDVTATAFSNLGISGGDFLEGFPLEVDLKFVPPLQERTAPLDYPSVANSATALTIAIALDELPDGILDSLGIPSGFIDSIGVRLTTERADFVDAYGMLTIPGGTYEVLRLKRTDIMDTRLEVYNSLLGWQDITEIAPIPGFGQDTTVSYQFLSDTEKEPIAVVTMDSTEMVPLSVDFKDNGVTSSLAKGVEPLKNFSVYPNPVKDQVTFSFTNTELGQYTLNLYDATGSLILSQNVSSGNERVLFTEFSTGSYTYQILNHRGQITAGGRLVKVNQ